jgi:fatty acid desaturase
MVEWWVRHPVRFLRYQYAYILLTFVGVHAGARRGHWGNRICIWGLAIVILTVMGPRAWAHFLLLWITPLATILPLFLSVRDVYQHHPAADLTRTYRGDAFTRWACFPYGQAFHEAHHASPRTPWYELRASMS